MRGLTFDQLILDAFDQLSPFYVSEASQAEKVTNTVELSASYQLIASKLAGSTTQESGEIYKRILPPQLTPQNLARFIGAANCCWVLEDFHKIDDAEKPRLSQLMKVFMDMSDDFPALKIIALGAVDTARQVVDYDGEMKNRIAEIRVDLMEPSEIREIIRKGESALNITFSTGVKDSIVSYSSGLASVCHHLCLNLCDAAGITQTSATPVPIPADALKEALKLYVQEASDSIKSAFDKALKEERKNKFDNARIILKALCKVGEDGLARASLLQSIRKTHPNYPNSNLEYFLHKLQLDDYGALIRFSPMSNCYSYADPFYKVFGMVLFEEKMGHRQSETLSTELEKLLRQFLELQAANGSSMKLRVVTKSIVSRD
ncbi:hypothetical protein AO057_01990 [Curvibacter sp. PAE-UM]|nr:hypothetical protein AO057_01990 [Curvibacter sp. PAE-UM]